MLEADGQFETRSDRAGKEAPLIKKTNTAVVVGSTLLMFLSMAGCGESDSCEGLPPFETVAITLTPDTVTAGEQTTIVASFDSDAFLDAAFEVTARIGSVGEYVQTVLREEMGEPPIVEGVILAGEAVDDRTFEMTVEFPAGTTADALPVSVSSDIGGLVCASGVLGEGMLSVTDES